MGIGSNWGVEKDEQEHEEAMQNEIFREAAILVVNGVSRKSAMAQAEELIYAQHEAISNDEYWEEEDSNVIHFNDPDLIGSAIPQEKASQVAAIEYQLREEFS